MNRRTFSIATAGLIAASSSFTGQTAAAPLILDEQDCWLKPDLVSKLVKIIKSAASELGFQMIMISHHDISAFVDIADKIYRLEQNGDTVQVSNSAVAE